MTMPQIRDNVDDLLARQTGCLASEVCIRKGVGYCPLNAATKLLIQELNSEGKQLYSYKILTPLNTLYIAGDAITTVFKFYDLQGST